MQQMNPSFNAVTTSVSASTSDVSLLPRRPGRKGVSLYNNSAATLYVLLDQGDSPLPFLIMAANSYAELPFWYQGPVKGRWASATGNVYVTEFR